MRMPFVPVTVPPLSMAVIVEPLVAWNVTPFPGTLLIVTPLAVTFSVVPETNESTWIPSALPGPADVWTIGLVKVMLAVPVLFVMKALCVTLLLWMFAAVTPTVPVRFWKSMAVLVLLLKFAISVLLIVRALTGLPLMPMSAEPVPSGNRRSSVGAEALLR